MRSAGLTSIKKIARSIDHVVLSICGVTHPKCAPSVRWAGALKSCFKTVEIFKGNSGFKCYDFKRQAFLEPPAFKTGSERMGLPVIMPPLSFSSIRVCLNYERKREGWVLHRNIIAHGGLQHAGLGFPLQLGYNPLA